MRVERLAWHCCVAWVLSLLPVIAAGARELPAAGAVAGTSGFATHGWFATADPSTSSVVLAHVPPRRMRGLDGKSHGASDGTVRRAADLAEMPAALAAVDDQVFVLFERAGIRSVGSVTARMTPAADLWTFDPPGRLRTHPDLVGGSKVLGFVGTPLGPAALLAGENPSDPLGAQIKVLIDDAWVNIPMPDARRLGDLSRCVLTSTREGLAIFALGESGTAVLWRCFPVGTEKRTDSTNADESEPEHVESLNALWRREPLADDGSLKGIAMSDAKVMCAGGLPTLIAQSPQRTIVYSLSAQSAYRIAELPRIASSGAVLPLDVPGRVVFAWTAPGEPASAAEAKKASPKLEIREISAFTGDEIYRGDGRSDLPVTARDMGLLTVLLIGVMVIVLLVLLRKEPDNGVYSIPEGLSLAEPGRRCLAGLIDFAIAAVLSSRIVGIPLSEVFGPTGMLEGQTLIVVGVALGAGFVIGTITEWLTGRSPGKLLVNCEVIDVRPPVEGVRRPTLGQAAIRNLVKWGIPPAAAFGLMEGEGRHRGDGISRTAVVIEGAEEAPDEDDF